MNAANTNMIPVVDKPLDINKVPDTPAEQFNPFSSTTGAPEASQEILWQHSQPPAWFIDDSLLCRRRHLLHPLARC